MSFEAAKQHFLQGLAELRQGALKEAEASFEASLALMPDRPSTLTNLASVRLSLGKPGEALKPLEKACALDDANAKAWGYRASALSALNRKAEALPFMLRAAALESENAVFWLYAAEMQQDLQQLPQALDSLARALVLEPGNATTWSNRGMLLRELRRFEEAAASFEKAIALGADAELNRFYIASVKSALQDGAVATAAMPINAPRVYVERLFDDYAADFSDHLVQALNYRGHERLVGRLLQRETRRYGQVLDVGCGGGLCGALVRPRADHLCGLDVSRAMVEKARSLGVYDALFHADVAEHLRASQAPSSGADAQRYDLIIAADVFNYIGALEQVFAAASAAQAPGGLFCFTVEALPDGAPQIADTPQHDGAEMQLLPTMRYAHSEAYVRRAASAQHYRVDEIFRAALREDQGVALEALYVYLAKT